MDEPTSQTPRVSIIVPTLERVDSLCACLDSIQQTVRIACETICVSSADDEPTQNLLAGRGEVTNIVQQGRSGFVKAVNAGFRAARGEYLLHINDDTRLLPHTVENAIRFLEAPAHDRIGLAALFHNSHVQRNIHQQIQLDGRWFYVCHVRGLCYANFGLGRRDLFERLGYFDERYFMYGADPDFSLKVWHEAGLAVAPCPGALIEHDELNDERGRFERAAMADDNRLLMSKWGLEPAAALSQV